MSQSTAWHALDTDEVFRSSGTRVEGLSAEEAATRLSEEGPNELEEKSGKTPFQILLSQFKDLMILVLLGAAIIAGFIGEITDSFIILAIVILNAIVGFIQEYKAENAIRALKSLSAPHSVVVRDGKRIDIPAREIVRGDIVAIEAGNLVPADMRLFKTTNLRVDESSLTGESVAVDKDTEAKSDDDIPLGDRTNMAFKGTFVTNGKAKGIVTATGMKTELGKIASLLDTETQSTPLQRKMAAFSKRLSLVIFVICAIIFAAGLMRGEDVMLMLLTAISLAVAAIPEALPAVITIALSFGAKRLVKNKALIRKLPAVETLGSVTYICSDKTGTLTQNKMTVRVAETYPAKANDADREQLFLAMALNNDVKDLSNGLTGDPMEIAFIRYAEENGFSKEELRKKMPRIAEIPFDSERMCMTTIHEHNGKYTVFTKGALGCIRPRCTDTDEAGKEEILERAEQLAAEGLRVLAFAYKTLDTLPEIKPEFLEKDLNFAGLAGLIDPARPEVKEAVSECKTAGIVPVMITGDYLVTAKAIASDLNILSENDEVMNGKDLSKMSEEELKEKVENIRVYARVTPEQKLNIVKALQSRNQQVAMTGDGVNDAPSLMAADIGVAMGITGTDVSKEAADMILLDDNFTTIVGAVRQGRRIYDNIRKFVKYILTGNTGEICTIALAPFFGLPMPLLPVHILWINLVTDGLPSIALSVEPEEKHIMKRPPEKPGESIFAKGLGTHIIWVGVLIGVICLLTQKYAIANGIEHWQTMVFLVLSMCQMAHCFAIRSDRQSLFTQGIFSNPAVAGSILLTFILQVMIIYVPALNPVFKTSPLSAQEFLISLGLASIVFIAVEIEKFFRRRSAKKFSAN